MSPIEDGTVCGLRDAIARRDLSAAEVCRFFLDRIDRSDARLRAFITVTAERSLARAAKIDQRRPGADAPPLLGVPVAVKDNICTRGVRTTAGSRMLDSFVAPYDATAVDRLERAGAVVIGKTNCDEFAMGSSTEHSAFGPSQNPWQLGYTPGGSSGGSAVAVAARLAPIALGSDTGGSIRQPASFCGVVGLKPTYGRVSRYGLIAFASSLDQIGPFARTAADAALVLGAVAGADPRDATASRAAVPDYTRCLTGDIRRLRIGVPRALLDAGVDLVVRDRVLTALQVLASRGAALVDVDLPHARHGIPAYYLVATAEASSNLARYDGVRFGFRATGERGTAERTGRADEASEKDRASGTPQVGGVRRTDLRAMYEETRARGFGAEVKRRIMLGTYVLSAGYYEAYYRKAQQARTLIRVDFDQAFEAVDVVALPTSPTPPFRLGERTSDPLQMYLADVFTVGASLAGLPAISVPCGFSEDRLPIGLQLIGRMFDEAQLLRIADAYERDTDFWKQKPPISAP